ncbi:hypothetical protein E4U23_006775 [Claviceps purpurea]|nr:hypothetical protein E4U23_006775 [Claviceps purpurea]KAG6284791.1 hypothetical protein E4U45_000793 [Claviceps purpurea]
MSNEAGPSNRRRMLSDTELDDITSEPSKRRRMPPPTELEDTASEGNEEYEATTLFTFLTGHNTKRPQPPRLADRVPDRILRYVPRYRSDPEHPTLERRERTTFEEQAVYLFATRDSVHEMNYSRLRDANVPVLLLCARHSHPRYASISSKDFNDLTAELLLSIWARVTLTTNIWTEAGLVEGVAVTLSISFGMPILPIPVPPSRRIS